MHGSRRCRHGSTVEIECPAQHRKDARRFDRQVARVRERRGRAEIPAVLDREVAADGVVVEAGQSVGVRFVDDLRRNPVEHDGRRVCGDRSPVELQSASDVVDAVGQRASAEVGERAAAEVQCSSAGNGESAGAAVGEGGSRARLSHQQVSAADVDRAAVGVIGRRLIDRQSLSDGDDPLIVELCIQIASAAGPGQRLNRSRRRAG